MKQTPGSSVLLALLFSAAALITSAQYAVLPCHFNSMCSCKMVGLPPMAESLDSMKEESHVSNNRTLDESSDGAVSPDAGDDFEQEDQDGSIGGDISCVGVPFASLPVLPPGRIAHVDIVNSGLQVADLIPPWKSSSSTRPRVVSLRLMSNKIRHVGDNVFGGMEDDLKSLDLSYNELDEMPTGALSALRALDWTNFHSNQIATLDGLGPLWTRLSPTLHALFLGNNDILTLEKAKSSDENWETSSHHSLSLLVNLDWLNVDGNHLTDLPADTLPRERLHTLSAANNRISTFPRKCIEQLGQLQWLDLRGNFIQHLPTESIRTESGNKLRLEKLDLGENLIGALPEGGALFNKSVMVRNLYLDFNRITRLGDSAFRGTNVIRLYLAANGLASIDERAFHSLSSHLMLLDLDRNRLRQFPSAVHHLKKLRFLYLANNRISHLAHNDLASFGAHLEALSLAGNNLEEFPALVLRHCPMLAHLNLAYNTIENVTSDMFERWADNLQVLILKGNQITQLPSHLFQHTRKLKELSLSFNRLTAVSDDAFVDVADTLTTLELNMALLEKTQHFPTSLLKPLRKLEWLSLEHNRLVSLPTTALDHFHKLRYLSLEGNRLTAIGGAHFKNGRLRSLQDIQLSYNLIETLTPRTFHNLQQVTTIVVANNRIQSVQHSAFDHLPKLTTVNLANNRIERVEPRAFRWLPNLLKLDLQSNRLREFTWDSMYNCTNYYRAASLNLSDNLISSLESGGEQIRWTSSRLHIKTIDLSHNLLSAFPDQEFLSVLAPGSLKKLLVGNNRIAALPERMLKTNCQDLQVLELQDNSIEEMERSALEGATNLQIVDLSRNLLEQLPAGFFANLKRLRIVDLSNNKLRGIPKDALDDTAVETLNLAHNHLSAIPACLSSVSSTLANLDVSHNQIDHLDAVMLSNAPNLVSLILAHNRLSLLPDNLFSHLNSLISLDLSYNTIRANFKELFHEIQHVKELNLANVGLNRWPHLPLPKLITLNLSSNALDYRAADQIPANIVIRLDHLRSLDLSRNRFTLVPSFLWPSTPLLKHLDLSTNPIRIINRDSFASLTRLQSLFLQPLPVLETIDADSLHSLFFLTHIKMQTWPGPHLSQLLAGVRGLRKLGIEVRGPVLSSHFNYVASTEAAPKLKDVEISGQQLKTIYPDVFANVGIHMLPECSVSLKQTALKHLPERFINGLEGCVSLTLDLRTNSLQTLGFNSIRNNNSLSATSTRHLAGGLWLDNNQWVCSCENTWMGNWLKRWYLETTPIRHPVSTLTLSSVTCRDPISSKKRHLVDLPSSDNVCSVAAIAGVSVSLHNPSAFAPVALLSIFYVLFKCQGIS